ncbi:Hypothetical protein A7982_06154 [Minicystis rosea]|nr:Hypothetical protein A7982_06154 [Minicystis rosea]
MKESRARQGESPVQTGALGRCCGDAPMLRSDDAARIGEGIRERGGSFGGCLVYYFL